MLGHVQVYVHFFCDYTYTLEQEYISTYCVLDFIQNPHLFFPSNFQKGTFKNNLQPGSGGWNIIIF